MDMNDLRVAALNRAADDSRTFTAGVNIQAAPEVIVTRAKVYLDFLLGTLTPKNKRAKRS